MSLWARFRSADYREALAAEAAGDLERAATAFSRAGRPGEVIRLRRHLATGAAEPAERVRHLRAALAVAEGAYVEDALRTSLRQSLARALVATRDSGSLVQAVALYRAEGDHHGAAEALLALGQEPEARAELAAGHLFERLERLDRATARREASEAARDAAASAAEARADAGDRAGALHALEALDPAAVTGAARALRARLVAARPEGRLALAAAGTGAAVTIVGTLPVVLGRGPDSALPLADAGISRHHARLDGAGGGFRLADLESRNGTWIDGLPVGAGFELPEAGRFTLGERCRVVFRRLGEGALLLEVERGLAAGARAVVLGGPAELAGVLPGLAPVRLALEGGWFRLAGDGLRLQGRPVAGPVDLLVGDRVEVAGCDLEVRRR